jgi:hypothetical protein
MSIESEEEVVWKALELYRAAAKEGKGHSSDRGALQREALANAYEYGKRDLIPEFLEPLMQPAREQIDPDFATYQRLKKKFEGKELNPQVN